MVFEDKMESPKVVVSKAKMLLENYQSAQVKANISNHSTHNLRDQNRIWKSLDIDQYKCN